MIAFRKPMCWFVTAAAIGSGLAMAHEQTREAFEAKQRGEQAKAQAQTAQTAQAEKKGETCRLTIDLVDAETGQSLPGVVRIKNMPYGATIHLEELIQRGDWYTTDGRTTVTVPRKTLRIEAFHGLETERANHFVDLTGQAEAEVKLPLKRFYKAASRGLRSGNTHLHLKGITRKQADRYLGVVSKADALDVVYISHLRRRAAEHTYITNFYTFDDIQALSDQQVLFGNGIEHRHNFDGRFFDGYGHVLLLNLKTLIRPISIGPDLMEEGTDAPALQPGIREARAQGGTAIWCHNDGGIEDIPNWVAGLLDAQNIFDGGNTGSYKDTFYRYLNLGLRVPFSAGSDWFIEDFSRVYVPVEAPLSSETWLRALAAGKSYITNGIFLEFQIGQNRIGDTIHLKRPGTVQVSARGVGRNAFQMIELVYNGDVVHSARSRSVEGHFEAEMKVPVEIDRPGWLALRLSPNEVSNNEFGHTLFAHTSPIYVELVGKRLFDPEVAREMIAEIERNIEVIRSQGKFANDEEREGVLAVYRVGIATLKARLRDHR